MRYYFNLLLCLALSGFAKHALIAQPLLEETFSYDNSDREGRFGFYAGFAPAGQSVAEYLSSKTFYLDTKGAKKGQLTIRFVVNNLKLRNKYKIFLNDRCAELPPELRLAATSNGVFTFSNKSNAQGKFVYEVVKNGSGDLHIGYDVGEGDVETKCQHKLVLRYQVTGIPDEEGPACQRAKQAFDQDKTGAEATLRATLRDYPKASCKSDLENLVHQIERFKSIDSAKGNCPKLKNLIAGYQKDYPQGAFASEVANLLKQCPDQPKSPPKPTTTAPTKSTAPTDWAKIKDSRLAGDYRSFIDKYEYDPQASEYVRLAKNKFAQLTPIQIEENRIGDFEREYTLHNVVNPRYKDMSLTSGLSVDASFMDTEHKLRVTLSKAGEYFLRIVDDMDKDTTIRISNVFSAEMRVLPGNAGYFIKISGGQPPYQIHLEVDETAEELKLRQNIQGDTAMILTAELEALGLQGSYRATLRSKGLSDVLDLGILTHAPTNGSPLGMVMLFLCVLAIAIAGYWFFWVFRKRRRNTKVSPTTLS